MTCPQCGRDRVTIGIALMAANLNELAGAKEALIRGCAACQAFFKGEQEVPA